MTTRIGQYEIIAKIASGGMGTVYRAMHVALHREAAVKVLLPSLSEDATALARFQREAQAASQLRHPNIIEIYDLDRADGQDYIAMEYVPGGSLQQRLREMVIDSKIVTEEVALRLIRPIADALNFAHEQGLIHRDIKPSNILLHADGTPVLADFGIVLAAAATRLTNNISTIGTPDYMSPEQGKGGAVDGRSDLYSLGIVMFEMLAGTRPFTADTPVAVVYKHIKEPLPSLNRTDVSLQTRRIIEKLTAKDPNDRFQTGADLVQVIDQALAALQSGGARKARAAARPGFATPAALPPMPGKAPAGRTLELVALGLLLLCVALAVGLFAASRSAVAPQASTAPSPTTALAVAPTVTSEASDVVPTPPSESATGTPVPTDTETPLPAPSDTAAAPEATVTPAGPSISLGPLGDLDELNSKPIGTVWQVAWSPDNQLLAVAMLKDSAVEVYSVPELQRVAQCKGHTSGVRSVAFSPDGVTLVSGASDNVARVWKLSGSTCTQVAALAHKSSVVSAVFQPSSSDTLATGSDDGMISVWSVSSGQRVRSWPADPRSVTALAFSPDGNTLISGGSDALIHLWTLEGSEVRQLKGHSGWVWDVAASPDGSIIASAGTGNLFNQSVPPDNTARLWRASDGQPLHKLPSGSHYVLAVAFSHDGTYVVSGSRYDSAPSTVHNLRFWRVDDGKLMGEGPITDAVTAVRFSPDGTLLAIGSSRSEPWGTQNVGGLYLFRVR